MESTNIYQIAAELTLFAGWAAYAIHLTERTDRIKRRLYSLNQRIDNHLKKINDLNHNWYDVMMDVEALKNIKKGENNDNSKDKR